MKRIYLILFGVLALNFVYGQNTQVTYKVTNYALNGVSYDNLALSNDISLSFYNCENGVLCFANHWRNNNSQSYGAVYAFQAKEFPETSEVYKVVEFKFTWHYFNTYDNQSGRAAVTINNIYIGNTVKFTAEIVPLSTNEIISMQGYLE